MSSVCFCCGQKFHPIRSDQLFCSKHCRYKYYHHNDMILTLKKKWFDMILLKIKTEEYREIKPYWEKRFSNYFGRHYDFTKDIPMQVWNEDKKCIVFRNGYGNDKPEFIAECTIREDYGKPEWGAENGIKYYVLQIHRVFGEKNILKI